MNGEPIKCGEGRTLDGKPVGCGSDVHLDAPLMFVCGGVRCIDCAIAFCVPCARKHFKESTIDEREKKLRETQEWAQGMADGLTHQTRVADGERGRSERLRAAGQALLDWYSAEHESMPAAWRVNHVLELWSALKKACDEPIVSGE